MSKILFRWIVGINIKFKNQNSHYQRNHIQEFDLMYVSFFFSEQFIQHLKWRIFHQLLIKGYYLNFSVAFLNKSIELSYWLKNDIHIEIIYILLFWVYCLFKICNLICMSEIYITLNILQIKENLSIL